MGRWWMKQTGGKLGTTPWLHPAPILCPGTPTSPWHRCLRLHGIPALRMAEVSTPSSFHRHNHRLPLHWILSATQHPPSLLAQLQHQAQRAAAAAPIAPTAASRRPRRLRQRHWQLGGLLRRSSAAPGRPSDPCHRAALHPAALQQPSFWRLLVRDCLNIKLLGGLIWLCLLGVLCLVWFGRI